MSKAVKGMVTDELRSRYEGIDSACVVDIAGMSVLEQQHLRVSLREKQARMQVVKNGLALRAFEGSSLEPLGKVLEGPSALIVSEQSVIDIAKLLVSAAKECKQLTLKQAIMDGDSDLFTVDQLSKMKSQVELIGDVAMLISSPGRAIAACLKSPQSKIAGCLKAVIEKAA